MLKLMLVLHKLHTGKQSENRRAGRQIHKAVGRSEVSMVTSGYELSHENLGRVMNLSTKLLAGCSKEYIPAVDKGVQEQLKCGVLAGYPMLDVKVSIFDGSYHDVDSNEMAF